MPVRFALVRARQEIVAVGDERFLRGLARFVHDGDAAFLAEERLAGRSPSRDSVATTVASEKSDWHR